LSFIIIENISEDKTFKLNIMVKFVTRFTLCLIAVFLYQQAESNIFLEQDTVKSDSTKKEKKEKKDLPLEVGRHIKFNTREGSWISVDISPDGSTIVFDLLGDLYTMPAAGGKATRISSGLAFDSHPRYSPDGKKIVFISDRSGAENVWIAKLEPDTIKFEAISEGKNNSYQSADFSPDSKYIVASKGGALLGVPKLWLFHVDGGSGTGLIEGPTNLKTVEPAFSPDGRFIYYSRRFGSWNYNAQFPQYQIAIYDRETGESETITSRYGSGFRPTPSPDGKWLAYGTRHDDKTGLIIRNLATGDEKWLAYPVQRDDQESIATMDVLPGMSFTNDNQFLICSYGGKLFKIPVNGGSAVIIPMDIDVDLELGPELDFKYPISDDAEFIARQIRDPAVSPDGKKAAFTVLDKIYVMDYPDGKPVKLTNSNDVEAMPAWSPDSKWIAYVTWSNEGGHIYKVTVSGKPSPVRLTQTAALYSTPAWAENNRIVYVRGAAQIYKESVDPFNSGTSVDLGWVSANGGPERFITKTRGRLTPHFVKGQDRIYLYQGGTNGKGLVSIRWDGTDEKAHLKVTGITTFGAQNPSTADLIMMAPEGDQAMAQVNNDVYVVTVPYVGGETPKVSVSDPDKAQFPSRKVTDIGGEFPTWGSDGKKVYFSLGNAFFKYDITAAKVYEDSVELAEEQKKLEEEKKEAEKESKDEEKIDEDKKEEKKDDEKKEEGYKPGEIRIRVSIPRDIPREQILLTGARLITMKGDEIIERGDIWIENNRIKEIGSSGSIEVPSSVPRMDMTGKTIIPGFVDTHSHMWPEWGIHKNQIWIYAANLAYGVTTTRDPQTATTDVLTYSDHVTAGNMMGPRIFSTGPGVGFWANNIQDLDHAKKVLRIYSDYYDTKTIKMYLVGNRQQRQWVIMAAKELGLKPTTEGALDLKLDFTQIIDGYPGHEHSFPIYPLYNDVVQFVTQSRTTYTPTLLVSYGGPWAENYYYATETVHDDPKLSYFTPHSELDSKSRRRGSWFMKEDHVFEDHAKFVKDLVEAGGLAGVGSHGQLQGLGYHWEIWSMQSGGTSNHNMLKVATILGATGIGLNGDIGSLEMGKLADLIVLDKNPLEDIRNTNSILFVMKNGRLYEGNTLNEVYPLKKDAGKFWWKQPEPGNIPGIR
jgi:Tol biopolymer transport system component